MVMFSMYVRCIVYRDQYNKLVTVTYCCTKKLAPTKFPQVQNNHTNIKQNIINHGDLTIAKTRNTQTALDNKANTADVYTKSQTNNC